MSKPPGVPKQMPVVNAGRDKGTTRQGIEAYRHKGTYDMTDTLKSPFPWPGGKSGAAAAIWARLGDTPNYVEPFAGSAAVLLCRPHDGKTETLNDADGHISNVLRSIAYAPEETAAWCDMPVSEVELTSWHLYLKAARAELTERLMADPFYHDPMLAGAWLYGIASWIGDGWCVADGPWINQDGRLVDRRTLPQAEQTEGVRKKMPNVSGDPNDHHTRLQGIQAYRDAPGVPRKMPEIGRSPNGQIAFNRKGVQAYRYQEGVPKQMPLVSARGGSSSGTIHQGVQSLAAPTALLAYFDRLAARLRRVRILCGDWKRVVKPSITVNHGLTSIFMDAPYPSQEHDMRYHGDNDVWHQAAAWAIENEDNPLLRIAVCGYWSAATDALFPATWERYRWQARGGYGNQKADGRGRENAKRECCWFSPHCIDATTDYGPLFEELPCD